MLSYRSFQTEELNPNIFHGFQRHQEVTKCWRKENNVWVVRNVVFTEDWGETEFAEQAAGLRDTLSRGGFVLGAFCAETMKGYVSVEPERFGSRRQYMELSCIQVSREMRGNGVGRTLFQAAKAFARARGAEKLYISAHSSVESQAFYRAMGCVEAEEYNRALAEKEPCDCQLECALLP